MGAGRLELAMFPILRSQNPLDRSARWQIRNKHAARCRMQPSEFPGPGFRTTLEPGSAIPNA
eukprot:739866-Alexandrium_andersonii.AAC.2